MSKKATALQTLYKMGRVTEEALRQAVKDGVITEEEYGLIVGE